MKSIKVFTVFFISLCIFVMASVLTMFNISRMGETAFKQLKDKLKIISEKEANYIYSTKFSKIEKNTENYAIAINNMDSYNLPYFEKLIKDNFKSDKLIVGGGFWLEYFQYDANTKYYGPYWYNDKGEIVLTWDYGNETNDYTKNDWYKNDGTTENKKVVWCEPYADTVTGIQMITATSPIIRNGKKAGVVTFDVGLEELKNYVKEIKFSEMNDFSVFLVTKQGYYLGHKDEAKNKMKITSDEDNGLRNLGNKIVEENDGFYDLKINGKNYFISFAPISDTGLKIVVAFSKSEALKPVYDTLLTNIIFSLIMLSLTIVIMIVMINKTIVNPINLLEKVIEDGTRGNLKRKVEITTENEIGDMSRNFNIFIEKLSRIITDINDYAAKVAGGTNQITKSMEQISASIEDLGNGATNTAAAVEELASTTVTVSHNADVLLKSSEDTLKWSQNGGEAVKETVKKINNIKRVFVEGARDVKRLGSKTDEIGEIVVVINDIAAQTNLLALNAAIEAARAGEAGKGFEVVAEEVRKLAEKTTISTKEIAKMVREIQMETNGVITKMEEVNSEVDEGVKTANSTGEALEKIVDQTEKLRDMVNMIANSTKEQSIAAEEIAKQTENITNNVEENSKAVDESVEAIRGISEVAEKLHQIVIDFERNNTDRSENTGIKQKK